MMIHQPISAQPMLAGESQAVPWAEASERLAAASTYWLATTNPDGRPHVRPLLAVWLDERLHFACGPGTRKGRNLARDGHCTLTAEDPRLHLVVEGRAVRVTEEAHLRRAAEEYAAKYGWPVEIRGGAFYAEGAPTAGPPPYQVFQLIPSVVFAFSADGTYPATRWRFAQP